MARSFAIRRSVRLGDHRYLRNSGRSGSPSSRGLRSRLPIVICSSATVGSLQEPAYTPAPFRSVELGLVE